MSNNIKSPFGEIQYLGNLLSKAYPTTLLFYDQNKIPVVVEWIDVDDNGNDIYYIFKTLKSNLENYLRGNISHLEYINLAEKKEYYKFHNSIFNTDFKKLNHKKLDKNSLPNKSSFFHEDLSDDYKSIADFFGIKFISQEDKDNYFNKLKEYSKNSKAGLFRVHLNEGNNIGHGTADTKVLGELLMNFENLYHETALDVIKGHERKAKINNLPENVSITKMSSTEVYLQEAASFSIYLKSKTDSNSNSKTYSFFSDEIFDKINILVSNASDKKNLESIKSSYSPTVFDSLKNFSEIIYENKIIIDLDYYNTNSNYRFSQVIKPYEANNIYENIISSSHETETNLYFIGNFIMLNTKTGYFSFLSVEKIEISGYVSNQIKESMISFNFKNLYKVTISQNSISKLNNNKFKLENTLESCILEN